MIAGVEEERLGKNWIHISRGFLLMSCRSEVGWKYGEVFAALRPLHVPIRLGQTRCLQGAEAEGGGVS